VVLGAANKTAFQRNQRQSREWMKTISLPPTFPETAAHLWSSANA